MSCAYFSDLILIGIVTGPHHTKEEEGVLVASDVVNMAILQGTVICLHNQGRGDKTNLAAEIGKAE